MGLSKPQMQMADCHSLLLSVSFLPACPSHVESARRICYSPGCSWNPPGHCGNPVDSQRPEAQVQLVLGAGGWLVGFRHS